MQPEVARHFLTRVARLCGHSGGLIIGVDLQKSSKVLEAAYNDSAGVTAAFNLNILVRANRELGADFDLPEWRHRAIYNEEAHRIEMHLISERAQTVHLGESEFYFAPGEKIITEFSYKHTIEGFSRARRLRRVPTRTRLDRSGKAFCGFPFYNALICQV